MKALPSDAASLEIRWVQFPLPLFYPLRQSLLVRSVPLPRRPMSAANQEAWILSLLPFWWVTL